MGLDWFFWFDDGCKRCFSDVGPTRDSYRGSLCDLYWHCAVGTFLLGIALFGDEATIARFFFIGLIITGIIGLKMAHKS